MLWLSRVNVTDGVGDLSVSREQAKGGHTVVPVSGEPQSQGSSLIHLHRKQLVGLLQLGHHWVCMCASVCYIIIIYEECTNLHLVPSTHVSR